MPGRNLGFGSTPGRKSGFSSTPGRKSGFGSTPGRKSGFGSTPGRKSGFVSVWGKSIFGKDFSTTPPNTTPPNTTPPSTTPPSTTPPMPTITPPAPAPDTPPCSYCALINSNNKIHGYCSEIPARADQAYECASNFENGAHSVARFNGTTYLHNLHGDDRHKEQFLNYLSTNNKECEAHDATYFCEKITS